MGPAQRLPWGDNREPVAPATALLKSPRTGTMGELNSHLLLSARGRGNENSLNLMESSAFPAPRQDLLDRLVTLPPGFTPASDTFLERLANSEPRNIFSGIWRVLQ